MEKLKERNTFKYNGNYCHVDLIEYDTHNDVNYAIEFHRNQTDTDGEYNRMIIYTDYADAANNYEEMVYRISQSLWMLGIHYDSEGQSFD